MADDEFQYSSGFGNEFVTEAVEGALPAGRNSPQQAPLGLYAEQLSGTAFTQPRGVNRGPGCTGSCRSAKHPAFHRIDNKNLRARRSTNSNRTRTGCAGTRCRSRRTTRRRTSSTACSPSAGNGDSKTRAGMAIHLYAANASMRDRYFVDSDGELLFVPELDAVILHTELGPLRVSPGEIAVVPRGIRFRVELPDEFARGYLCENFGASFTLPERGPIGANGLANERDFMYPHAAFEERDHPVQVVNKFGGNLWAADYDHSPLDVVAWHGSYAPYKYDTANFMVIGIDQLRPPGPVDLHRAHQPHATPRASPTCDFVVFAPRWLVGENTFRPPWFHRNVMSEYMGLVSGAYDAKAEGFVPGGGSLHNTYASHGPDADTYAQGEHGRAGPAEAGRTLAFMFESPLDDPADQAGDGRALPAARLRRGMGRTDA